MKITIANKKLLTKPQTVQEKKSYFKDIKFKTGNFQLNTFKKIIENGCTITYIFKDDEFTRDNHFMSNNYVGAQFICVDVDKCDVSATEFIENINYKPTFYHSTFSNLSETKNNKYCFHLIYCFDEIIYGESNFSQIFNTLTEDYAQFVDNAAKDCHRVIFTSNSSLPNFEFGQTDIIYQTKNFLNSTAENGFDDFDTFFDENKVDAKNKDAHIYSTTINIQASEKMNQLKKTEIIKDNSWHIEESFFNDLNSMPRKDFLDKYLEIYPYINRTMPTAEQIRQTKDGIIYENWINYDYCEVPSKFRYINGERTMVRKQDNERTKSLMFDCLCFIKCIPNITKEYLVTMLIYEVFHYYFNNDGHITNHKIIEIAKYGWNLKDNITFYKPIKKNFKIISSLNMSKNKAVGVLNKLRKDDEIGENIDLSLSLDENIKLFKTNGIKITKQRLIQFCSDYEVELLSEKEIRNQKIIELHNQFPQLSARKLEQICNENGINVKYSTIQRVLNTLKND